MFPCFCQRHLHQITSVPPCTDPLCPVGSQDVCSHAGTGPAPRCRAVPSALTPAAGTTSAFATRACEPERCSGQLWPSHSSQCLLRETVQVLAFQPAAETSCCTGLSLHCSQKRSSSVRKELQLPPFLGGDDTRTQCVALSAKHLSCSPHPLPPRKECLHGTQSARQRFQPSVTGNIQTLQF